MKTDNLIQALAADGLGARRLINGPALFLAALVFVIGAGLFLMNDPIRYNLFSYGLMPTLMKLGFTVSVIFAASLVMLRNARPSDERAAGVHWLWLPIAIFGLYFVVDIAQLGTDRFGARLWGYHPWKCFSSIVAMAALPLVAILLALKQSAPRKPGLVGLTAGLISSSAAACIYALYCSNDSPFYLVWYVLAMAVLALVGGLLGKRVLAW